jgi:hypothetical protein
LTHTSCNKDSNKKTHAWKNESVYFHFHFTQHCPLSFSQLLLPIIPEGKNDFPLPPRTPRKKNVFQVLGFELSWNEFQLLYIKCPEHPGLSHLP